VEGVKKPPYGRGKLADTLKFFPNFLSVAKSQANHPRRFSAPKINYLL